MRRDHGAADGWMIATVVAALAACEGRVVELGGSNGVDSGGGSSSPSTSSTTASYGGIAGAAACPGDNSIVFPGVGQDALLVTLAPLAPLVGTWTGYAETSDNMTLVFTQHANAIITASLTFGTAPPPAPPTAKTDVFPPGFDGDSNSVGYPYAGFPYTTVNVSFDGTRLQLGIVRNELWKAWCGLQTSYDWAPNAPGMCGCLPDWGGTGSLNGGPCTITNPTTGAKEAVPCVLVGPCAVYPVCSCNAAGCSVDMLDTSSTLDVQLASNKLDGSITGLSSGPLNVHLTRSP